MRSPGTVTLMLSVADQIEQTRRFLQKHRRKEEPSYNEIAAVLNEIYILFNGIANEDNAKILEASFRLRRILDDTISRFSPEMRPRCEQHGISEDSSGRHEE